MIRIASSHTSRSSFRVTRWKWVRASPVSRAAQIQQIADTMAKHRPGTILYALGMTQHTTGVQGIRGFTILQLLLGNVGKPGSGVNALRGEPNVQGACDMGVLNNYMPGYLNYPAHTEPTLAEYTKKNGTGDRKYLVNMLKAFYGDAATPENDFGYTLAAQAQCPKGLRHHSIFEDALAGKLKMLWVVGQNPAVTTPNLKLMFDGMAKLEMLVVQEIWETETATFWRRPGVDPKSIATEVILLPAAFFMEKNGTITNSGGMVQWRHAAVKPPGQAKPDGEIVDLVFRRVRELVNDSTEERDVILKNAFWTYTTAEDVLREINGRALRDIPDSGLKTGDLVKKISDLQPDGSTSCGVLDLRGRVWWRSQSLQTARLANGPGRSGSLSELRMDLAEQHAHPLQPRFLRSSWQAISRIQAYRLVG